MVFYVHLAGNKDMSLRLDDVVYLEGRNITTVYHFEKSMFGSRKWAYGRQVQEYNVW